MSKKIVPQPHWKTSDEAAEVERDGYVMFESYYLQQPVPTPPPEDPLIAKRNEFYLRFAPEAAERHWRRWLEQREAIDKDFDRNHPYWEEYKREKGWH